jgi:hypothetical protein
MSIGLWLYRTVLVAVALWLGWMAWTLNLDEACRLNEWPYLERCPDVDKLPTAEQARLLQERLARNPGDSQALVRLAALAQRPGGVPGLDSDAALNRAVAAAPQDPRVLRMQSNRALNARQWPQALDPLVRLARHHLDGDAAQMLARMIAQQSRDPALQAALIAAVKTDAGWLDAALYQMPPQKLPVSTALPLVDAAAETGQLKPKTGQFLIAYLKSEGLWLEAYGVWLRLWNRPMALLFNADFEQEFLPNGFDWEVLDTNGYRAGAKAQLSGRGERGQVLMVGFTGREMPPVVVQQHVLLTPGKYRLTGEYLSSDLRSNEGLAWVLACAKDRRELARTPPIRAEGRAWQRFDVAFDVPQDCGLGVALGLQPQAPYEARTGMRGEVLFDRFSLKQE